MKKLFFGWLVLSAIACAQAQQASPTPQASPTAQGSPAPIPVLPPGPLLKAVPDRTQWTVTTSWKPAGTAKTAGTSKPAEAPKQSRMLSGQKVDPVIHVSTATDNGTEDRWSDSKVLVTTNAAWSVPLFSVGRPEEFPRPGWISRKNIKEIKKVGDKEYWIFRDHVFPYGETITKDMLLPGENPENLKVDAIAVIDGSLRLPVSVQEGEQTITYKYEALPAEATLNLPPEIQASIAERLQKIQATTRRAVRP